MGAHVADLFGLARSGSFRGLLTLPCLALLLGACIHAPVHGPSPFLGTMSSEGLALVDNLTRAIDAWHGFDNHTLTRAEATDALRSIDLDVGAVQGNLIADTAPDGYAAILRHERAGAAEAEQFVYALYNLVANDEGNAADEASAHLQRAVGELDAATKFIQEATS